jgi:hypothetical protein
MSLEKFYVAARKKYDIEMDKMEKIEIVGICAE